MSEKTKRRNSPLFIVGIIVLAVGVLAIANGGNAVLLLLGALLTVGGVIVNAINRQGDAARDPAP